MRRPPRHFGLILLTLLAGCAEEERVGPRSLADARQRWRVAGPADYDLVWSRSRPDPSSYRVAVRGGEVREVSRLGPDGEAEPVRPADPSAYGVEGLFDVLEREADQLLADRPFGRPEGTLAWLTFLPDRSLGYPRVYRRQIRGEREPLVIEVRELVRVAPNRETGG